MIKLFLNQQIAMDTVIHHPGREHPLRSSNQELIINGFTKYTFYIAISIFFIAVIVKCIHYWKRYRKNEFSFKIVQDEFMGVVNNSLAAYFSEKSWARVIFFLYGSYCITIGFPILIYLTPYKTQDPDETSRKIFNDLGYATVSLISGGGNFIQMLLIVMIGAKNQMIHYTKNPVGHNNTNLR